MLDVSALVHQMHDTLSQIHETITSLDTKQHDEKLDALEAERDSVLEQLHAAFQKQREELEQKRKSERDEIAEKRRKEDEEIAARRKREDEELQTRDQSEDSDREKKLEEEKKGVETETDSKMEEVETEAQRLLDDGHKKISELEKKRREINSLIDEQMKAPLPPPPKRRRGTRSAPAQSAPAEPAQPAQEDAPREIAAEESAPPVESAQAENAPAEPAQPAQEDASRDIVPEESAQAENAPAEPAQPAKEDASDKIAAEASAPPTESAQAENAPAEAAQPAQEDASREVESQESAPVEPAPTEEPEKPREIAPETTSTEGALPEEAPTEKTVPETVENPVPETTTQAESTPEETNAESAAHGQEAEEAKPEPGSTDPASAHEEQPREDLPKDDSKVSEDADEAKEVTNDQPEHQQEPTGELEETAKTAEPKQDEIEDQSARPDPNTADEALGDQAPGQAKEDKTTAESPDHHEESAQALPQETNDATDSKPELAEDSVAKDDSHTSDHPDEPEKISQGEEKTADEPSTIQEESTKEVPSEPTGSKEDPVAEHNVSASSEPQHEVPQTEQAPTAQSQPPEDPSSASEAVEVPEKEEQATKHNDPSSEGIAKGGAAEDYLKMAEAEPSSHHEDSAPVSVAVDKSEPEPSSTHDQAMPQEDTNSAEPTTSRDMGNAEVIEKADDGVAAVHEEEPSQARTEATPAPVPTEVENVPSEVHDGNDHSEGVKEVDVSVPEDKSSQDKSEDTSAAAPVQSEIAPTETHDEEKSEAVKEDGGSSALVHDEENTALEASQDKQETTSDANEEAKIVESQPEADSGASKPEDHDAGDSTAQDLGHGQHPSDPISQDHDDAVISNDVDQKTDSGSAIRADAESAPTSEAQAQPEDTNEAKAESTEAEPMEEKTAVDPHDEAPSSKDNEHHPTEQAEEPQTLQPQTSAQKEVSSDVGHHEQDQEAATLSNESEHKDQDNPGSRDLEGGIEQEAAEHSVDHAGDQALGESAPSMEHDHSSVEQTPQSLPKAAEGPDNQQKEDVEEVLEGSGNDQAPSRGLDVKDSESHPAEENFDLSGNEPIPGTMTHGVDPEGAEKDAKDGEIGDKTTDRDMDAVASVEKSSDALEDHTISDKAADSQEGVSHPDGHQAEINEPSAVEHVSEHQPDVEAQGTESTDRVEPEEHSSSSVPTSHDQDPTTTEGQESSDKPHEDAGETLAPDSQNVTAEAPPEAEQPPQNIGADKADSGELTTERGIVEDSEKPSGHEAPAISVTEHKLDDDSHPQDSKPLDGADESSSRELSQTDANATTSAQSGADWDDGHDSGDARRPSTIQTDIVNPDDDADVGLFAVPPTPRDEVYQQKPTSLQASSPPPQTAAEHDDHDDSTSLPDKAEASHGTSYGTDSNTHGDEAGAEHNATGVHEEEDRSSQPPWLAQNGHSEELPQLQTGSVGRDIEAHETNSAHSRDGSYHEDFKLSPVAYTPTGKKSVESFQEQKANEAELADTHEKHAFGDTKAETSSTAQVEEQSDSHRDLAQPDGLRETNTAHANLEPHHPADQSSTSGSVEQLKEHHGEEPSRDIYQEQNIPSAEDAHNQILDDYYGDSYNEDVAHTQQPTSYASGVNYDGEGYGPSPTEEQHYDAGATAFPRSGQSAYSPGLTGASQSATRSSFSGHDTAAFSYNGDDRTETESHTVDTPTVATSFDKDQSYERAETPEQFHHALGNLPDESAHTVQGTDDLFDDDDDSDASSDYGEAIVEPTEKLVYQADGSHENVALGGNHSSLSLGRNSMASQGSYGHRSAGSHSSFGSVRETTPLRVADGSYLATSPSIVRADWAGDYEDELRQHSRRVTPQLQPSTVNDTPGISPFALRNTPAAAAGGALGEDDRGLAASRWSPRAARPQTPPSNNYNMRQAAAADSPQTPSSGSSRLGTKNPFRAQQNADAEDVDPSMFMPRDVTNTPWHARNDSIPMSLHSQTTLSSAQESPIHSSLAVDRHEPVIRDSWPTPAPGYQQYLSGWGGRPRGDSSLSSNNGEYDPFKADSNGSGNGANNNKSSIYNPFQQRGRAESSVSAAPSAVSASPSRGSGLFHKMRSVFEQGGAGAGAGEAPSLTRPVSGTYHAVSPLRSPARPEQAGRPEEQDYSNRSGY
ncbi:hypothetical protein N0V82_001325 [Gnomoniopsis sp. IMI 355080]|nr:hypothetical protein N0V82_001325 [Gnomoniopsis sp. IMI 355080]